MQVKYEVSISYNSEVIAKAKVDNIQTDWDKNNMPQIILSGVYKKCYYLLGNYLIEL